MIFYVIALAVYIGLLVGIRPQPESLKEPPIPYGQHLRNIAASLITGVVISSVFLLTSEGTFIETTDMWLAYLGLSNNVSEALTWPLRAVSSSLVHGNYVHLLSNLSGLGIASVYERRVGTKRYLAVMVIGALCSAFSIFCYRGPVVTCGISGGVFALGAAYFTDRESMTTKEWLMMTATFSLLAVMMTMASLETTQRTGIHRLDSIDHFGHLFGAISAIVYCKLRPLNRSKPITE